jgi:hypothetical protein
MKQLTRKSYWLIGFIFIRTVETNIFHATPSCDLRTFGGVLLIESKTLYEFVFLVAHFVKGSKQDELGCAPQCYYVTVHIMKIAMMKRY